jgi:hypothetical protein
MLSAEGGLAKFGDGRFPALHPGAVGLEFLPLGVRPSRRGSKRESKCGETANRSVKYFDFSNACELGRG